MLVLAGLGISDERGLTLEEIDEIKDADEVFLESYTSIWGGNIEKLEKIVGKEIKILKRRDLEENVEEILKLAMHKKVVIFVPGDPMVATTHSYIVLECKKRGIPYKVIHNSSIISAICEIGLHAYKFGAMITIPLKEKIRGSVDSIIEVIRENKKRGLHTLCLLDIDIDNKKFLEIKDAVKFLIESGAIDEMEKIVVVSCLGINKQKIFWKEASYFLDVEIELPAVVVILGNLHFLEREFLDSFTS